MIFRTVPLQSTVLHPLQIVKLTNADHLAINTTGGGAAGQAGAARLAISRALLQATLTTEQRLKPKDCSVPTAHERTQKIRVSPGTRKRFQFSKQ